MMMRVLLTLSREQASGTGPFSVVDQGTDQRRRLFSGTSQPCCPIAVTSAKSAQGTTSALVTSATICSDPMARARRNAQWDAYPDFTGFGKTLRATDMIGGCWSKLETLRTSVNILYLQYFYVGVYTDDLLNVWGIVCMCVKPALR